ncbi:hypothetical protein KC326_g225 [Hortaea werneckii]|nr:hypothetical protein KC326_g225 [Hortaea werneckii]
MFRKGSRGRCPRTGGKWDTEIELGHAELRQLIARGNPIARDQKLEIQGSEETGCRMIKFGRCCDRSEDQNFVPDNMSPVMIEALVSRIRDVMDVAEEVIEFLVTSLGEKRLLHNMDRWTGLRVTARLL